MTNYYLQFSEQIDDLTKEETDWLKEELSVPDLNDESLEAWCNERGLSSDEDAKNWPDFDYNFSKNWFWLFSKKGGSVENVAWLIQRFLKKFRPGQSFSLTWAKTCSKLRLGEFTGGGVFITAEGSKWFNPNEFIRIERDKWLKKKKKS